MEPAPYRDTGYAWIEQHRDATSTTLMCELLSVSRSGLYQARTRPPSARAMGEQRVVAQIRDAQHRHRGRYGRRRMTPEVSEALGRPVNHKRMGRLLREHGLRCRRRRAFRVVTTDSTHEHPIAPNHLARDFEATAPNQKWLADLTYIPTAEGWLYLALVLDLLARQIVGWAMDATMPQALTTEALQVALGWRDPEPGLLHHSDRGSHYAAQDYRQVLDARGIVVSMSRKATCWDNAPMESVNGTVKVECVHGEHLTTRAQAQQAIVEYIGYYNTERRHSALGYLTPAEYERYWHAGVNPSEQVSRP